MTEHLRNEDEPEGKIGAIASRAVSGAHLLAGAVLTARPHLIVSRLSGPVGRPAPVWVARALGARMLAQGVAEALRPSSDVLLGGALVDVTHAASMVPAAAWWREYRRAALTSGLGALACAVLATTAGLAARRDGGR